MSFKEIKSSITKVNESNCYKFFGEFFQKIFLKRNILIWKICYIFEKHFSISILSILFLNVRNKILFKFSTYYSSQQVLTFMQYKTNTICTWTISRLIKISVKLNIWTKIQNRTHRRIVQKYIWSRLTDFSESRVICNVFQTLLPTEP